MSNLFKGLHSLISSLPPYLQISMLLTCGETEHYLKIRAGEHISMSVSTGKKG